MQPIKIFFSCAPDSDRDKRFVLALEKHFADQTNYGEVKIWHVHKASPGSNVQQEILTNLNRSDIILIFLSPDYMNNAFCVNWEGAQAASLQISRIAIVRVLLIRPIAWRTAPFNVCEVLPESGEFISSLRHKEEELLHDIALDIYALVKEARSSRSERDAKRVEHRPILQQAYYMPVMPTVESLVKTKQTDEIKLNKLKRKTDEIKGTRQTEGLKPSNSNTTRKTDIQSKQGSRVLADNVQFASTQEIQSFARAQRRNRAKMRAAPNTFQSKSTRLRNWLEGADKEYEFINKGSPRKLFFYLTILIDSFGIATAVLALSKSGVLFGLALFISLSVDVIGAVNTGKLLPIPLALIYTAAWGIIIDHFFLSLKLIYIFGIILAVITLIHLMLFHKNSRWTPRVRPR